MGAGLRYVNDDAPGIRRLRCGRGFRYVHANGKPVVQAATLERIRSLAIPPAYRDVWICAAPDGHLQATGRDARGRKQYRYHPDWTRRRSADKFAHLVEFGTALPRLRRQVRADLRLPGLPREKVLALVIAVMGRTLARVGNDAYARGNGSYGLTTLRNRHLGRCAGGGLLLEFTGKSGRRQRHAIDDPQLVRLLRRCQELPGQSLFQYVDAQGTAVPIDSGDINHYLRQAMGGAFSAKDFRTWGGTAAAAFELARYAADPAVAATVERQVMDAVAAVLGNTTAVCRRAYVDPCVFDAWHAGALEPLRTLRGARARESAVLRVLRAHHRNGKGAGRTC